MPRVRRTRDEARQLILDAAARLLVEGGPRAVEMRAVAQRVGMTDAGVAHHFGSRDALLAALLRQGGRRIRAAVAEATGRWLEEPVCVETLIAAIATVYAEGYGELAIAVHAAGWRDDGGGMLAPVVDALHAARAGARPSRAETRLAVAALHQALATEAAYGPAFRRSAGIKDPAAARSQPQLAWWAQTIRSALRIP
jgi:AcrR family transcriptional regulator